MRVIQFHPEARRELRAAAEFYRDESPGLGRAFVAEVRVAAARIAEFPQSGAVEVTDIRRILLKRFPFALMYRSSEGSIEILAAMHQRREPAYWRERLEEK